MKRPLKIVLFSIIAVFVVVFLAVKFWQGEKTIVAGGHLSAGAGQNTKTNNVVVKEATTKLINDRLTAIGTGRALATVAVTPWSSGVMDQIFVHAGAHVHAGDPVAKLDSDNEEIAVERAKVEVNDAELTMARTVKLRATNTATEVQEISAKLALDKAKLALRDAELAADRRTIRSPISGIVGILPVDAGNYVTSGTTIARIDNRDNILIDVWVPERFAPLIKIGQEVRASSLARPGEVFVGAISAIDNMIDEKSRTLRVQAEIDNEKGVLQSGMSFSMAFHFQGDPYVSVDPLAIQWNGEGAYVWRVRDAKAERVKVAIVQRNADCVLVTGKLAAGEKVVVEGVQNLQENSTVKIIAQSAPSTIQPADNTPPVSAGKPVNNFRQTVEH
ncbi:efflux RND transporter periplasmic adaptor subunit [uncultured Bartonella sp.]|uniref:efflux RND transporter periplasmic adaptor subunit n=1 Tax=uncultured Bartonella sp. TaxID=104108 RepID=UPI002606AA10|nr:efflux RND transporter periplasmic adaptor subunit [uncultured Bartonella sp.]